MFTNGAMFGPRAREELVIGALGSGKTTYVKRTYEHFQRGDGGESSIAKPRRPVIVNLDPANEFSGDPRIKPAIDINEIITVNETMRQMRLGPNGSIVFCMEYLEANVDWLVNALQREYDDDDDEGRRVYFLFDLPGQAEIVTHHESLMRVLRVVSQRLQFRFVAIHLVDSTHVRDVSKFISVALLSLVTMMRLELPHINILSKFDLIRDDLGSLDLPLDFFTEMGNPMHLTQFLSSSSSPSSSSSSKNAKRKRYHRLVTAICELLEEYSLVSFTALAVDEDEDLARVLKLADKAIGF